ncbi:MAG: N-acetylmuramoyl-L-alanine amidase [Gemmatimonadetes bacterium]|nr:N-acetylmuramoyl-L-alanine amidase [Gemmatimonadota bacterium]
MIWHKAISTSLLLLAVPVLAQEQPTFRVEQMDGTSARDLAVMLDRGYAVTDVTLFEDLGWGIAEDSDRVTTFVSNEVVVSLRIGSPFFRWDGVMLQMTHPPYRDGSRTLVPLQLLTEFFPEQLPDLYEFDGPPSPRRVDRLSLVRGEITEPVTSEDLLLIPEEEVVSALLSEPDEQRLSEDVSDALSSNQGERIVIIDAGHGGEDPGALGPEGIHEKDVALGIALELLAILEREPDLTAFMIREDDTFVDLWRRGEIATEAKGDRPGVFVSIHANSSPNRRSARGFETYFLSEARTEHERRVSAIENAPLSLRGQNVDLSQDPDLGFILRELRTLDHQHWSALLAEMVQEEIEEFHPGPNRGVKQGLLAVLTNALMPSVLIETGYLSNDEEARMLRDGKFQRDTGQAVADAVLRFFKRYPPGVSSGLPGPAR